MANAGPIHLYEDERGVFTPQFESPDGKEAPKFGIRNHYLGEPDWAFLRDIGAKLNIESVKRSGAHLKAGAPSNYTCTATTVPTSVTLTFHYTTGVVYGGVNVCGLTRPSGTTTQTVDLQFWSYQYGGSGAHLPIATWFNSTFHAQGMYVGHSAPTGTTTCPATGDAVTYNSSLEWWSLWQNELTATATPKWVSTGNDLFTTTCGKLLLDSTNSTTPTDEYRVQYEANASQDMAYVIYKKSGGSWNTLTGPILLTSVWANWVDPITGTAGTFDASNNGVGFGSTVPAQTWVPPNHPGWWVVNISNISNSWY